MKPNKPARTPGVCSRCGECCRWLPLVMVLHCKPHQLQYLRERGLKESNGYFLADAPCRHLHEEEVPDLSGRQQWSCDIYETRPATCRDYCGRTLSAGKRFYIPESCTMAGDSSVEPADVSGTQADLTG